MLQHMQAEVSAMTQLAAIERFLSGRRLALVGVSAQPEDFSRLVLQELQRHGYDVVAVNPKLDALDGTRAYGRVQDVPGPLDGAILMTSPRVTSDVVRDCAAAQVPRVWMHRGAGRGAVSDEAVRFCEDHGIEVIAGECPMMFLSGAEPHATHAALRCTFGSYPRVGCEPRAPRYAPLVAAAGAAWAVGAAALAILAVTGVPASLASWTHALIVALAFGVSTAAYFRRSDHVTPLRVALLNVTVAATLDLARVGFVTQSWDAYGGLASTWLALALVFAFSLIAGTRSTPRYLHVRQA